MLGPKQRCRPIAHHVEASNGVAGLLHCIVLAVDILRYKPSLRLELVLEPLGCHVDGLDGNVQLQTQQNVGDPMANEGLGVGKGKGKGKGSTSALSGNCGK